jgi:putative hydrolase of the HAD superfamily
MSGWLILNKLRSVPSMQELSSPRKICFGTDDSFCGEAVGHTEGMEVTTSASAPTSATTSAATPTYLPIRAVLWDFGGVILSSPFDAFAKYENENSLPPGLIRSINSQNPDANAWAQFERSDVSFDGFCSLFEAEALQLGHSVDARRIMSLLHGEIRPQMVEALRKLKAAGYLIACLTNNVQTGDERDRSDVNEVMAMFDHVTQSRHAGVRKPERKFYEMACEAISIEPTEAVFLDDLGINLKPAAALGMRTIKVGDPDVALGELEALLGMSLR